MNEMIEAGILQIAILGTIVLAVVMFIRLRRKVSARAQSRGRATFVYLGWTLLPFAILVVLFFGMVGLEELTGSALVPEMFARASPLAAALCLIVALIAALVFAVAARPAKRS